MQRITIEYRRKEMPGDVRFALILTLILIVLMPIDLALNDIGFIAVSHGLGASIVVGVGYVLKLTWPYRHMY